MNDVFPTFAQEVLRDRPTRLTIVSPWVDADLGPPGLRELLAHAGRFGAAVDLITRPLERQAQARAITSVLDYERGRVFLCDRLHAKLYVCEADPRRGFAVVGSANMTDSSRRLDEVAVIIRPLGGSQIVRDIGRGVVISLTGASRPMPRERGRSTPITGGTRE